MAEKLEDVSNTPLDEDDLYDISKDLTSLAAKWKEIGIALRLRCGVLDKIDSGRPDRCLSYVIENWLKKNYNFTKFGPPTWRWLVEIVADPAGGNDRALADEIAKKHLIENKPDQQHDSQRHHHQSPEHKHVVRVALQRKHTDPGPTRQHSRMKYKRRSVPTPKYQADVSSLVHEPWYHGDISWEDAEERLEAQDSDCFLVRKSQSQPGKYILSVSYGRVIKDFVICIHKESQCYEVEGAEKQFSSLEDLIAFYKDHNLTVDGMTLTTPCPPPKLKPIPHKQIHQTVMEGEQTLAASQSLQALPPTSSHTHPSLLPSTNVHSCPSMHHYPPSPPDSPVASDNTEDSDEDEEVVKTPEQIYPWHPRAPRKTNHGDRKEKLERRERRVQTMSGSIHTVIIPVLDSPPRPCRNSKLHCPQTDQSNTDGDTLLGMASVNISAGSSQSYSTTI